MEAVRRQTNAFATSALAASATFALKAGVWFRRARLLIVSPDSRVNLARRQAETPLIPPVQILEASSRPIMNATTKQIAAVKATVNIGSHIWT
jgi:hypothetical protein